MASHHTSKYEGILKSLITTFANVKDEKLKSNGFRIIRYYLTCFYLEVIAPIEDLKQREDILLNTTVMADITDVISQDLDNYHESVKEEA